MNRKSLSSLIIIFLLIQFFQFSFNKITQQNYLIIKNDKISAIHIKDINHKNNNNQNFIFISNNQNSIKIQLSILEPQDKQKYPIKNYTSYFPSFYENILLKGYIKPVQQNLNKFVKGYKLIKSKRNLKQSAQIINQIQSFLLNKLQENKLNELNFRLEDNFQISFIQNELKQLKINSIYIEYLFPTVQRVKIPSEIKSLIGSNIYLNNQITSENNQIIAERRLLGRGFHQTVNITLKLQDQTDIILDSIRQTCYFEFSDILPQTTYIDSDQKRKQTINYQVINVQLPAFISKQYFYKYRVKFTEFKQIGVHTYVYQQPIHFRYPKPSQLNITKIQLHSIQKAQIICSQNNNQKIFKAKENLLFSRGIALIPNGDSSMSQIVSIVTLAVCLIVVLKITGALKKN